MPGGEECLEMQLPPWLKAVSPGGPRDEACFAEEPSRPVPNDEVTFRFGLASRCWLGVPQSACVGAF